VTRRREAWLLVIVCLVAYGTGLGDVAFYTRGEPREGLVVREMLRTGEWIVPQRPEGEVARKPPLYYWLAAPIVRALPAAPELALRLPSAVVATAAILGTWAVAGAIAGDAAALPAALVLATAFEWTRSATAARVDMTLAAALTLVLAAWLRLLAGASRRWLVAAAAGATLATLAKGPVGLAVPALAALAYAAWRRDAAVLRQLGVVPVLGIAALVAGVWYLIAFAEQGRAFFDVVLKENVVRFIDTDDARTGHAHGIFYLPLLGLVGWLPWVPLLPLAVPARRDDERLRFAAVWAGVVLVFFSLANAKRSVYLLPAFPALAVLVGAGVASGGRPAARWLAATYLPALVTVGGIAVALAAGIDPGVALHRWLRPDDVRGAHALAAAATHVRVPLAVLGCATLVAGVMIERARRAGDWSRLVVIVAAAMVVWTALFDATIHPAISRTRSPREFMTTVDRLVPADVALYASFPVDPGVRFYSPRPLVRLELESASPRWVLVWEDEWRRLRDARDEPLPVLTVSEARQSRRGALALVMAPAGRLRRVAVSDGPAETPGLRAAPGR
jgi:4-amino-4-deoxy-L-arabinose transferase-like glycosyltransferase